MNLSPSQARIVRELSRTPGRPVHWTILADAIGEHEFTMRAKDRVWSHIQVIREKFGKDAVLAAPRGTKAGFYLPRDWSQR